MNRLIQRARARARKNAGFTIIEVMTSMGIMVVGVMAIVGLQQHTVIANAEARQLSIANQIAQTWLERFKQDAATWTDTGDPAGPLLPAQVIANTRWLFAVNAAPNVFQTIPNVDASASNTFDYRGVEIAPILGGAAPTTPIFCVGFRPAWVYAGHALRVDVRVYWRRARSAAQLNDCNEPGTALNPGGALFSEYHTMYLSTVLKNTVL